MTVNACLASVVSAPFERIWSLIANPVNFDRWWDAKTVRVLPMGPARTEQIIVGRTRALGRDWEIVTVFELADKDRRLVRLTTRLPFGI